jgi:hypothetical protein
VRRALSFQAEPGETEGKMTTPEQQSGKNISFLPTPGLSYDPSEERYWDPAAVDGEVHRAFEICQSCRMCFKYCDAFPVLFGLLDKQYDGGVRRLTQADVDRVMDSCFQCKLCEVQCPSRRATGTSSSSTSRSSCTGTAACAGAGSRGACASGC